MPTTGRIILATLLGFVIGSAVNIGLIAVGGIVVPAPDGADATTSEGLRASMHLFTARHFVFPFLAHAVGTLAGAVAGTVIVAGGSRVPAGVIGCLFLAGGVVSVVTLPSPLWFSITDLTLAYLPMAALGHLLVQRRR